MREVGIEIQFILGSISLTGEVFCKLCQLVPDVYSCFATASIHLQSQNLVFISVSY